MAFTKPFRKLGDHSLKVFENVGRSGIFLVDCLISTIKPPFPLHPVIRQLYFIGSRSGFVILFTGLFTGMVLGLQGYYTLTKFGSTGMLGSAVALSLIRELDLPIPDLLDTAVGTELHYGEELTPDLSWRTQIGFNWKRDEITKILQDVPGLFIQPEQNQSEFKISYEMDTEKAPKLTEIRRMLRKAKLKANVIFSLNMCTSHNVYTRTVSEGSQRDCFALRISNWLSNAMKASPFFSCLTPNGSN